jgi:hypothetical protein
MKLTGSLTKSDLGYLTTMTFNLSHVKTAI